MKLIALPVAAAAALTLAACDSTPADTTADATATETVAADPGVTNNTTVVNPAPTATETVTVDTNMTPPNSVTVDGKDVDATVSSDGVNVKVKP